MLNQVDTTQVPGGPLFTVYPRAQLFSLQPHSGPASGGTRLLLHVSAFATGALTVRVGPTNAVCQFLSATTVECDTPALTPGTHRVKVSTDVASHTVLGFSAEAVDFFVYPDPVVTGLSPSAGPGFVLTTSVSVAGNMVLTPDSPKARVGQVVVPASFVGGHYVVAVPALSPGLHALEVSPNGQQFSASGVTFAAFSLRDFEPKYSPLRGTRIAVSGSSIPCSRLSAPTAYVDNTPLPVAVQPRGCSPDGITFLLPALPPSTGDATMTLTLQPGHTPSPLTSAASASRLLVYGSPVVTDMQPRSGPTTGGTNVTFSGHLPFTGLGFMKVGTVVVPCHDVRPDRLVCTTPPGLAVGATTLSITVDNPAYVLQVFQASPHRFLGYLPFTVNAGGPRLFAGVGSAIMTTSDVVRTGEAKCKVGTVATELLHSPFDVGVRVRLTSPGGRVSGPVPVTLDFSDVHLEPVTAACPQVMVIDETEPGSTVYVWVDPHACRSNAATVWLVFPDDLTTSSRTCLVLLRNTRPAHTIPMPAEVHPSAWALLFTTGGAWDPFTWFTHQAAVLPDGPFGGGGGIAVGGSLPTDALVSRAVFPGGATVVAWMAATGTCTQPLLQVRAPVEDVVLATVGFHCIAASLAVLQVTVDGDPPVEALCSTFTPSRVQVTVHPGTLHVGVPLCSVVTVALRQEVQGFRVGLSAKAMSATAVFSTLLVASAPPAGTQIAVTAGVALTNKHVGCFVVPEEGGAVGGLAVALNGQNFVHMPHVDAASTAATVTQVSPAEVTTVHPHDMFLHTTGLVAPPASESPLPNLLVRLTAVDASGAPLPADTLRYSRAAVVNSTHTLFKLPQPPYALVDGSLAGYSRTVIDVTWGDNSWRAAGSFVESYAPSAILADDFNARTRQPLDQPVWHGVKHHRWSQAAGGAVGCETRSSPVEGLSDRSFVLLGEVEGVAPAVLTTAAFDATFGAAVHATVQVVTLDGSDCAAVQTVFDSLQVRFLQLHVEAQVVPGASWVPISSPLAAVDVIDPATGRVSMDVFWEVPRNMRSTSVRVRLFQNIKLGLEASFAVDDFRVVVPVQPWWVGATVTAVSPPFGFTTGTQTSELRLEVGPPLATWRGWQPPPAPLALPDVQFGNFSSLNVSAGAAAPLTFTVHLPPYPFGRGVSRVPISVTVCGQPLRVARAASVFALSDPSRVSGVLPRTLAEDAPVTVFTVSAHPPLSATTVSVTSGNVSMDLNVTLVPGDGGVVSSAQPAVADEAHCRGFGYPLSRTSAAYRFGSVLLPHELLWGQDVDPTSDQRTVLIDRVGFRVATPPATPLSHFTLSYAFVPQGEGYDLDTIMEDAGGVASRRNVVFDQANGDEIPPFNTGGWWVLPLAGGGIPITVEYRPATGAWHAAQALVFWVAESQLTPHTAVAHSGAFELRYVPDRRSAREFGGRLRSEDLTRLAHAAVFSVILCEAGRECPQRKDSQFTLPDLGAAGLASPLRLAMHIREDYVVQLPDVFLTNASTGLDRTQRPWPPLGPASTGNTRTEIQVPTLGVVDPSGHAAYVQGDATYATISVVTVRLHADGQPAIELRGNYTPPAQPGGFATVSFVTAPAPTPGLYRISLSLNGVHFSPPSSFEDSFQFFPPFQLRQSSLAEGSAAGFNAASVPNDPVVIHSDDFPVTDLYTPRSQADLVCCLYRRRIPGSAAFEDYTVCNQHGTGGTAELVFGNPGVHGSRTHMVCQPPALPVSGDITNWYQVFITLNGQNYNADGVNSSSVRYRSLGCPAGMFAPHYTARCQACPAGTFDPRWKVFGDATDSYPLRESTECEPCPLSTYQPLRGQPSCLQCPINVQEPDVRFTGRQHDDVWSSTPLPGQVSNTSCGCRAGYFRNPTAVCHTGIVGGCCSRCPDKAVCDSAGNQLRGHEYRFVNCSQLHPDMPGVNDRCTVEYRTETGATAFLAHRMPVPGPGVTASPPPADNTVTWRYIDKCSPEVACLIGYDCALGYEGRKCGVCSKGWYRNSGLCSKCPNYGPIALALGLVFAVVLFVVAGKYGKIFVGLVVFKVLGLWVNSSRELIRIGFNWPDILVDFFARLSEVFSPLTFDLFIPECEVDLPHHTAWVVGLLLLPGTVYLVYVLGNMQGLVRSLLSSHKLVERQDLPIPCRDGYCHADITDQLMRVGGRPVFLCRICARVWALNGDTGFIQVPKRVEGCFAEVGFGKQVGIVLNQLCNVLPAWLRYLALGWVAVSLAGGVVVVTKWGDSVALPTPALATSTAILLQTVVGTVIAWRLAAPNREVRFATFSRERQPCTVRGYLEWLTRPLQAVALGTAIGIALLVLAVPAAFTRLVLYALYRVVTSIERIHWGVMWLPACLVWLVLALVAFAAQCLLVTIRLLRGAVVLVFRGVPTWYVDTWHGKPDATLADLPDTELMKVWAAAKYSSKRRHRFFAGALLYWHLWWHGSRRTAMWLAALHVVVLPCSLAVSCVVAMAGAVLPPLHPFSETASIAAHKAAQNRRAGNGGWGAAVLHNTEQEKCSLMARLFTPEALKVLLEFLAAAPSIQFAANVFQQQLQEIAVLHRHRPRETPRLEGAPGETLQDVAKRFKFGSKERRRRYVTMAFDRAINAGMILLNIAYGTVSRRIVDAVVCTQEANGNWVMVENPNMICFSEEWWTSYFPFAAALGALWVIGLPVAMLLAAWSSVSYRQNPNLLTMEPDERHFYVLQRQKARYGYLFLRFMATVWFMEFVLLIQRSFVTLFAALTVYPALENPWTQGAVVALFFGACLWFQLRMKPFNDATVNMLGAVGHASIMTAAMCGLFFQTLDADTSASNAFAVFLVIILTTTGAFLTWYFLDEIFTNVPFAMVLSTPDVWRLTARVKLARVLPLLASPAKVHHALMAESLDAVQPHAIDSVPGIMFLASYRQGVADVQATGGVAQDLLTLVWLRENAWFRVCLRLRCLYFLGFKYPHAATQRDKEPILRDGEGADDTICDYHTLRAWHAFPGTYGVEGLQQLRFLEAVTTYARLVAFEEEMHRGAPPHMNEFGRTMVALLLAAVGSQGACPGSSFPEVDLPRPDSTTYVPAVLPSVTLTPSGSMVKFSIRLRGKLMKSFKVSKAVCGFLEENLDHGSVADYVKQLFWVALGHSLADVMATRPAVELLMLQEEWRELRGDNPGDPIPLRCTRGAQDTQLPTGLGFTRGLWLLHEFRHAAH